jgi:hypothetical protein
MHRSCKRFPGKFIQRGTFVIPMTSASQAQVIVRRFVVLLGNSQPNGARDDATLVTRAVQGDAIAIRLIMQRYNRRLYRIARSVVRDEGEAEDVVQEGYLRAFTRLHELRGQSSIGSWLARIVLNEAIAHVRRRRQVIQWRRSRAGTGHRSLR